MSFFSAVLYHSQFNSQIQLISQKLYINIGEKAWSQIECMEHHFKQDLKIQTSS